MSVVILIQVDSLVYVALGIAKGGTFVMINCQTFLSMAELCWKINFYL